MMTNGNRPGDPKWRGTAQARRTIVLLFVSIVIPIALIAVWVVWAANWGSSPTDVVVQEASPQVSSQLELIQERQDQFERFVELMLVPMTIFLAFVAAGGALGVVFSIRNEVRAGQIHGLLVAGETAQQARTESLHSTLLEASERTITLVNQTLELARDSAAQATRALSDRAKQIVQEVSQDAAALVTRVLGNQKFAQSFFKLLVEEPPYRRRLLQLSERLSTIEGYLEFQDIDLAPTAYFVKGMAHHLNQDADGATRMLSRAAAGQDIGLQERLCSYYFMGYAHNNLGQYLSAAAAFDSAFERVSERNPLRLEFARMSLESRFFDLVRIHLGDTNVQDSVDSILHQLSQMTTDAAPEARANLSQLQGNIHLFLARHYNRQDSYQSAYDAFRAAGDRLWPKFGRREIHEEVPQLAFDDIPSVEDVEALAREKVRTRGEPRSLVLLHLAIAWCRVWEEDPGEEAVRGALAHLDGQLNEVDSDIRLYSLRFRSNVERTEFLSEDQGAIRQRILS